MNTSSIYPAPFISRHNLSEQHSKSLPTRRDMTKKQTEQYGIGVFALRPFARGEAFSFLAEQTPHLLQHSLQRSPGDHLYDPHFVGFLLHSCNPNIVLDMRQQKVFCIRDIPADTPLYMDYASTEDILFNQFACNCHAPNCREWITGRHEPVNMDGAVFLERKQAQTIRITNGAHAVLAEHTATAYPSGL